MLRNVTSTCPYCGEKQMLEIDLSDPLPQEFISDCTVCCRPMEVTVTEGFRGGLQLKLRKDDDTD